jgi:hypothetical protein
MSVVILSVAILSIIMLKVDHFCADHFREALGSDSPMSEDLMSKVNITKKRIPVLSDLRTEALKERHWKQVKLPCTMSLVQNDIGME